MPNESISKICAVERAADAAESDALERAEQIVRDAHKKAEEITGTVISNAKKTASAKISDARKKADLLEEASAKEIAEKIGRLGVGADSKQADINKAILGIIV